MDLSNQIILIQSKYNSNCDFYFHLCSDTEHTIVENVLRFFLVIFALLGLNFFDILYIAVVITYVSQNQLIQYYIGSIIDKVRAGAYHLDDAVKVG